MKRQGGWAVTTLQKGRQGWRGQGNTKHAEHRPGATVQGARCNGCSAEAARGERMLRQPSVCNDGGGHVSHTQCMSRSFGAPWHGALFLLPSVGNAECDTSKFLSWRTFSESTRTHEVAWHISEVHRWEWARKANGDATTNEHREASEWGPCSTCSLLRSSKSGFRL